MIRNLKVLGIALGAVFAMSAMMATMASATDLITTSKEPAVITGTNINTNIFKITNATGGSISEIKCSHAKFAGTVTKSGAKEVTIFATYEGTKTVTTGECETTLGNATVDMNTCDYDLTGETTKNDPKDPTGGKVNDAVVSVTCKTVGDEIKITAPGSCTISVPAQTPTEGGVVYTAGEELVGGVKVKDLTIDATVTGITFTSTAACQLVGIPKEGNNSDYNGTVTATCWEDKGAGAKEDEFVEGSACDLSTS